MHVPDSARAERVHVDTHSWSLHELECIVVLSVLFCCTASGREGAEIRGGTEWTAARRVSAQFEAKWMCFATGIGARVR